MFPQTRHSVFERLRSGDAAQRKSVYKYLPARWRLAPADAEEPPRRVDLLRPSFAGTGHAALGRMRIRHYRELACFQLSSSLRAEMSAVLDRPKVRRDFEFCDQVRDATRSAVSNIAEGFGRSDADFLRFLGIAMGSLREIETHLDEARLREYLVEPELARLRTLAKRAHCAAARLCAYLRRSEAASRRRGTPRRRSRRT